MDEANSAASALAHIGHRYFNQRLRGLDAEDFMKSAGSGGMKTGLALPCTHVDEPVERQAGLARLERRCADSC
jgi:hypothetical protein